MFFDNMQIFKNLSNSLEIQHAKLANFTVCCENAQFIYENNECPNSKSETFLISKSKNKTLNRRLNVAFAAQNITGPEYLT